MPVSGHVDDDDDDDDDDDLGTFTGASRENWEERRGSSLVVTGLLGWNRLYTWMTS